MGGEGRREEGGEVGRREREEEGGRREEKIRTAHNHTPYTIHSTPVPFTVLSSYQLCRYSVHTLTLSFTHGCCFKDLRKDLVHSWKHIISTPPAST